MKKRITILSISIVVIILFIVFLTSSEDNLLMKDGITYAININGIIAKEFPQKGLYNVDVICENAECKWDYENWQLKISNITGDISCGISFNSIEKKYLNDEIIKLDGQVREGGQVVHETFTASIKHSTFEATEKFNSEDYIKVTNDENYPWLWDETNKTWTSTNKGDDYKNTTSTIKFSIKEAGNYQVCYKKTSELGNDYGYIMIENDRTTIVDLTNRQAEAFECRNIYLESNYILDAVYHKDSSINVGDDELTFYLQKGIYTENISEENFDAGYRYEGENPNNYVLFNNELWRIIGVFDENTHGQKDKKLVKIIRNNSLGSLAFSYSQSGGKWPTSRTRELLNNYYYNKQNATNTGHCYYNAGNGNTVYGNCDYRMIGLSDYYKKMIKEATWYLGGLIDKDQFGIYDKTSASNYYLAERSNVVNHYYGVTFSVNNNIGLIYPSDYGFSVLKSDCSREITLNNYRNNLCSQKNWLFNNTNYRTITSELNSSGSQYIISSNGAIGTQGADYTSGLRPVLYLNENVYVLDGDGSITDPYIIAMDEEISQT